MAGIDLSTIGPATIGGAGAGGFLINGQAPTDLSGGSVAGAGDVNGDGFADLIVGAYFSDPASGANAGRSYVVFGRATTTATNLSAIAAGTGGFVINGQGASDYSGFSVAGAGDINGDGLADLIVGAFFSDLPAGTSIGRGYVVFGQTTGTAINLSAIANSTGGFVINGQCAGDYTGYSVANAGDVNGDGLADLIVGANGGDPAAVASAGRSYVVFGRTTASTIELSAIAAGNGGFVINGQCATDFSGKGVASAGDVNGDGLADLIVGAPFSDLTAGADAGRSYVVFGRTGSTPIDLSVIANGTGGFVINGQCAGDLSGRSVASAGDVNGDGLSDLIIGAYKSDPTAGADAGRSYVVFGQTGGTAINLAAVAAGTGGGFVINGQCVGDNSGRSVASAGDINGDGLSDLIIGAWLSDPTSSLTDAGRSYVVFGKAATSEVNLSAIAAGTGGFAINGQDGTGWSGGSVASAGDVNGDGLGDLIVGAKTADDITQISPKFTNQDAGRSYVIFGSTTGVFAPTAVNQLGTSGNETLTGTTANETLVAGAGNDTLNANGGTDVLYGGAGNDSFVLNASNLSALDAGVTSSRLARIDGGAGIDTLALSGTGLSLNLYTIANQGSATLGSTSRIESIERIDLTGSGNNSVWLTVKDVIDMAGSNSFNDVSFGTGLGATVTRHQLVIDGNPGDTAILTDAVAWTRQGAPVTNGTNSYKVFNHNSVAAQVLVDTDVSINIIQTNSAPTGALSISGTATQGQTLTATIGTLADSDGLGTLTYQWKAGGVNINGATGSTLLLTEPQVGKIITVAASYTDLQGTAESASSNATAAVVNLNDAHSGAVAIEGTVAGTKTLSAVQGTLADLDGLGTLSYQWQMRNDAGGFSNISGATNATLVLAGATIGHQVRVIANYTDGHGTPESSTSVATVAVPATIPNYPDAKEGSGPASAESEVAFMSNLTVDLTAAPIAYGKWDEGSIPATYNKPSTSGRWGTTPGTGAVVTYRFDTPSSWDTATQGEYWTSAEKSAYVAGMALWSAEVNITFTEATVGTSANLILFRRPEPGSETEKVSAYASNAHAGQPQLTEIHVAIDSSVWNYGIPLDDRSAIGWGTIVHEIGHAMGLEHAGPYNFDKDPKTQQFSKFDTQAWGVLSYINPEFLSDAKYFKFYPEKTLWGFVPKLSTVSVEKPFGTDGSLREPYTPMILDILATQRMYGTATEGPLASGGQVFGFNTNITGPIRPFYDFSLNKNPVVTLWDGGVNNTLDMSGFSRNVRINLNPGSFSSSAFDNDPGRMIGNIVIAQDTIIETAIAGPGNDAIIGSDADNTLRGNAGNDNIKGGPGIDSAVFSGLRSSYILTSTGGNNVQVAGPDGTDKVKDVEKLVFDDQTVNWPPANTGDDYANSYGDTTAPYGEVAPNNAAGPNNAAVGILEHAGDRDWFVVKLQDGTSYVIDLQGTQGGGGTLANPYLRLYDRNGALIEPANDDITPGSNLDSRLNFTPTSSGLYYLESGASGDNATGTYKLTVTALPSVDDYANNLADTTATFGQVTLDGSKAGKLGAPGDQDWFRVDLLANTSYSIVLQGVDGGGGTLEDPYLSVYASNGELLDENDDSTLGAGLDSQLYFVPRVGGTYYVEASASDGGTGTYKVSYGVGASSEDDYADWRDDTQLSIGQLALNVARSGKLEFTEDRDWFSIQLSQGKTYTIKLQGEYSGAGTLEDPYLRLYDGNEKYLDKNDDATDLANPDSQLVFVPSASGIYYIAAGAFDDEGTGSYQVSVLHVNAAPIVANAIADRGTNEDAPFSFIVPSNTFADADVGDSLTFSASKVDGALLPGWLSFNSSTLGFSGTPANGDVGVVNVRVTAKDSDNAAISEDFALTIANTNDAPVAGSFSNRSAGLNQPVSLNLKALFTDVDVGDTLNFGATGLPSGFGINAATGVISGTAPAT
ncbi:MAG: putative Ig domain-containing protein, partial [Burkholderiales bacterium]